MLFVAMASCVSGALLWVLLRLCLSLQSLEGFVLTVMDSTICFHLVCCSCKMSSDICLFSVCILLTTSCEGSWRLRGFLERILCAVSIESGDKAFDSPGEGMELTMFDDYFS